MKIKIAQTIDLFLEEISKKYSSNTVRKYEDTLSLFKDFLTSYGDVSYSEDKNGRIILTADTSEFEFGHTSQFLEWFLIRKVMAPQWMMKAAPGIIKKYFKWLDEKGLLGEGVIEEVLDTTKQASKDLPRVDKAAELLFNLCSINSSRYFDRVFDDDAYMEGYGELKGMLEDKLYLLYEGERIGPIQVTKKIAEHLKEGDTINLAVGRVGKKWIPLEVGNVYPK
ncbi:MAG: hypothetical protein SV775_03875 [Thermodesulfobacteriota bacterium]|nr:hypothetical protein [Thermodesulfobacteriota bacterium]